MNRHCHRLVFNRSRGQIMAVAETSAAQGKQPGETGASQHLAAPQGLRTGLRRTMVAVWLCTGGLAAVNAQIIADTNAPRGQQPTVLTDANGRPLVNIQTPSAAGVREGLNNPPNPRDFAV